MAPRSFGVPRQAQHTAYAFNGTEQTAKTVHDGDNDQAPKLSGTVYDYDLRGRMSHVAADTDGDDAIDFTVDYAYNPDGIRVGRTVTEDPDGSSPDVTTYDYVIASENPTGHAQVLEEHVGGSVNKTFTMGHSVLSQDDPQAGALTFIVDGQHSTMALAKEDAGLAQRFAYDAYGSLLEGHGLALMPGCRRVHATWASGRTNIQPSWSPSRRRRSRSLWSVYPPGPS